MTDKEIADQVYLEPITLEFVSQILRKEHPDAILPTLGGQQGLNMAMELSKSGILDELHIELLGTKLSAIDQAEDREQFKALMEELGEPCQLLVLRGRLTKRWLSLSKLVIRSSCDQPLRWGGLAVASPRRPNSYTTLPKMGWRYHQ